MNRQRLPIISIVGTTSVGKSEAALHVARTLLSEKIIGKVYILSADSRQVYVDLPLLTGADVPPDFSRVTATTDSTLKYFSHANIEMYGLLFRKASEDWSVAQFHELAWKIINKQQHEQAALLVVGGTGLYHQQLLQSDPQLHIPPNPLVREKAATLTIAELQEWLGSLSASTLNAMNMSDRNNPRRLQRAIEVALVTTTPQYKNRREKSENAHAGVSIVHQYYGLVRPLESLKDAITARVRTRIDSGVIAEVAAVLQQRTVSPQVHTALGFSHISEHIAGNTSLAECITSWSAAEYAYSKRQLTWWKKQPALHWFEREKQHWLEELTAAVCTAYEQP